MVQPEGRVSRGPRPRPKRPTGTKRHTSGAPAARTRDGFADIVDADEGGGTHLTSRVGDPRRSSEEAVAQWDRPRATCGGSGLVQLVDVVLERVEVLVRVHTAHVVGEAEARRVHVAEARPPVTPVREAVDDPRRGRGELARLH